MYKAIRYKFNNFNIIRLKLLLSLTDLFIIMILILCFVSNYFYVAYKKISLVWCDLSRHKQVLFTLVMDSHSQMSFTIIPWYHLFYIQLANSQMSFTIIPWYCQYYIQLANYQVSFNNTYFLVGILYTSGKLSKVIYSNDLILIIESYS